jgi:hypothetical protein
MGINRVRNEELVFQKKKNEGGVKVDGSGRMIRFLSRNTFRVNCNISMVSKRKMMAITQHPKKK